MKTIKEKAKEFCNKCRKSQPYCPCTLKERHNCLIYDAYYHGAIEQWQKDNKQLCEMVLDNQQALIDKACEFWHKALVDDKDPYKSMWLALIEKFRKEMTTVPCDSSQVEKKGE